MIHINIIFVGTIKERYLADAVREYEKRLSGYALVNNISIREERLPDNPSAAEINAAVAREGERILAALPPRSYTVALCVEGKQYSSPEFARLLSERMAYGSSEFSFIIGGSDGLYDAIKRRCDLRLSISEMTFPHQLMRVILLEQLYRAYNILSGGKYHK